MAEIDDNDIAIVGMALRVPGASTPEQYWANLCNGVESVRFYSDQELAARGVSAETLADGHYVKAGAPLEEVDQFDPEFFGFSPKEAAILDPQHRQFYEVAWEALERAGHPPQQFDGAIAVFAGCGMGAYFAFNLLTNPDLLDSVGLFLLRHTGNDKDFLATRVSYSFNLKGPSINVQTACSTSLVATHLAVQSLLSGECDMALAGGVTIELPHAVGYHYREGEILSPDGHCRAFDHRAKGTIFGSGAGVVVLRRLSDALADGDHIHAVIKGSAVNNDGSGKVGYLAPSVEGQAAAVIEALAVASVSADSIGYVECHGTGTPVGDPIEIAALTRAFRESSSREGYCGVGSVKSNIGHLDTAAGVASLIKATLALEHGRIPPTLNFEAPNPVIAFEGSPFYVASSAREWPRGNTPRRAGINSLGVGGTNAFVVLEEPPLPRVTADSSAAQLLLLSARNRKALDAAGERLVHWLRLNPDCNLADVAHTLQVGRHAFEHRRVLAAPSADAAALLLESADPRRVFTHTGELDRPSMVFMYPGGGAQYFRMGVDLYRAEPVFREHMDAGLALLKSRFSTDLDAVFLAGESERETVMMQLAQPSVQLPLIFMIEYALTQLWAAYGIKPAALIGHSMGENTAACIAGVMSFQDALGLVLLRGQLMDEVPAAGMLSVQMPAEQLIAFMGDTLDLAAANSPGLSVASGPAELLDALAVHLAAQGIDSQRVRINIAAHSRLLDGILDRFRAYLESIELKEPRLPVISNRSGAWLQPQQARDPGYWVAHLRNSVLFADGVRTLLQEEGRVFLEVGPGNTLGSFVRQNPVAPTQRVFASLRHPDDPVTDDVHFRTVAGRLWGVGVAVDLTRLNSGQRVRLPLPSYAFQHARYWIEPGIGAAARGGELEKPLRLTNAADWMREPRWVQQGVLELVDTPCKWLALIGREPLARKLVERLRAAGNTVVVVRAGDTFARTGDFEYLVAPEAGGDGYLALLEDLVERDLVPDRILHTWLVTWDTSFRPGSSFFHRNQEYGFYSLFYLARALAKAGAAERGIHFTVIANGVHRVAEEPAPYPEKATVLGPCAVIPREFSGFTCSFVDVDLPRGKLAQSGVQTEALAAHLMDDLCAKPETAVIAWRDGVRSRRHVFAHRPLAGDATPRLRERGVYLITGGLGGIGGVIAEWLAREYRARLILLGRTPLPQPDEWDDWLLTHAVEDTISAAIRTIRHLRSQGAEVLAVAADVTVADRVRSGLEEAQAAFGRINGVFHAAGVIRDSLIQLKSQREIEEVFAAKVYGTVVLDELFRTAPLDFMLLFASTSAYIAPQGQIDYVGANAFLNAFAEACRGTRPWPVTAINWGIWKNVGMVAGSGAAGHAASEDETSHATSVNVKYPLFEQRHSGRDGLLELHIFDGSLSTSHWIIDDHRLTSGDALLPGTGYIELIRASLAELGDNGPWQIGNLVFDRPLFVASGQPRGFRVRLRGSERHYDVDILARVAANGWERCATARVTHAVAIPARLDVDAIEGRCTLAVSGGRGAAMRTRQEAHLRFGPRWRVLRRLGMGSGEACAQLELAESFADDVAVYALHPGLLDIATGCAMDLIAGYSEQEVPDALWVPVSYRALRFHAPLPARVFSWIRVGAGSAVADRFASFDVVITDSEGRVLVEVEHLLLSKLAGTLPGPVIPQRELPQPDGAHEERAPRSRALTPGELALRHNVSQGIGPEEGIAALSAVLSSRPQAQVIVSSMDVGALLRQADVLSKAAAQRSDTRFARPELDSEFAAPRDEVERKLAELWAKLLGVEGIGINDSFFDLGGHSLIAVRLFNDILDCYGVDLPMSVLMQASTIESLAERIRGTFDPTQDSAPGVTAPRTADVSPYRHIVPMHSGPVAGGTPLFIVAGMFGNVLNLSHLAHLLGEDRPFYAVQARGLYGDSEPHQTFEEAAADYIAEMRQVQPAGPYLVGGFSGGGITAYEIARQLLAAGERIALLVLLDTPLPQFTHLSFSDRVSMFWQGARAGGIQFLRNKVRERIAWEKRRRQKRLDASEPAEVSSRHFQSQRIGDAFLGAIAKYRITAVPIDVALFRPKLDVRYRLSGGRVVNSERDYIYEDNGWTPLVSSIRVFEVPGDHDGMVLEPNVRVLVSMLRKAIATAESRTGERVAAAEIPA